MLQSPLSSPRFRNISSPKSLSREHSKRLHQLAIPKYQPSSPTSYVRLSDRLVHAEETIQRLSQTVEAADNRYKKTAEKLEQVQKQHEAEVTTLNKLNSELVLERDRLREENRAITSRVKDHLIEQSHRAEAAQVERATMASRAQSAEARNFELESRVESAEREQQRMRDAHASIEVELRSQAEQRGRLVDAERAECTRLVEAERCNSTKQLAEAQMKYQEVALQLASFESEHRVRVELWGQKEHFFKERSEKEKELRAELQTAMEMEHGKREDAEENLRSMRSLLEESQLACSGLQARVDSLEETVASLTKELSSEKSVRCSAEAQAENAITQWKSAESVIVELDAARKRDAQAAATSDAAAEEQKQLATQLAEQLSQSQAALLEVAKSPVTRELQTKCENLQKAVDASQAEQVRLRKQTEDALRRIVDAESRAAQSGRDAEGARQVADTLKKQIEAEIATRESFQTRLENAEQIRAREKEAAEFSEQLLQQQKAELAGNVAALAGRARNAETALEGVKEEAKTAKKHLSAIQDELRQHPTEYINSLKWDMGLHDTRGPLGSVLNSTWPGGGQAAGGGVHLMSPVRKPARASPAIFKTAEDMWRER